VEAVALGINQGELAVALLLCWATAWYIRARRRDRFGPRDAAGILLLYLAAALFKENALILPGLLLAAELTVIREPSRNLRPFYLACGLVFALVLAARFLVLGGDTIGTFTAPSMIGAGPGGRALTMLGVVPHWARLLFWPAELQADYGPREIVAATGWGLPQWAGAAILVAAGAIFWAARRRAPALAFGLGWTAVALIPVSNVLVPTGIALAERTLFLASAGATISAGAVLGLVLQSGQRGPAPALRWAAFAAASVLLALGAWHSRSRIRVWHDQGTLLQHTVADAPTSIGAHLALVRFLEDSGSVADARRHYREATLLNPGQLAQDRGLGDQYLAAGLCQPAIRLYRRILSVVPDDPARESLQRCLEPADSVSLHPKR
jgi:tetratricopeptide (TPR) repeat protein